MNVANTEKYVTFNHYRKTLQNYVEIPYVPLTPPNKGVKIKIKGKNWEGLPYLAGCALYAFSTTKFNYLAVLLSPAVKFGNCNLATESQNPCGSTED